MIGSEVRDIISDFKKKVCDQVTLEQDGVLRYYVNTPFTFDDGDAFTIILKNVSRKWLLTDEGHTLMHLSYWIESDLMEEGKRKELIEGIAETFHIVIEDGQLNLYIEEENFGNSLFSYIQALTKISDVDFLSVERTKSVFLEDFRRLLTDNFKEAARFDWTDAEKDEAGAYSVDCRLDTSSEPIFLYAVWNNERALNTTVSIMKYKNWGYDFNAIVVHEDLGELNKKNLYRIMDAADKQFPSFYGKEQSLVSYLKRKR